MLTVVVLPLAALVCALPRLAPILTEPPVEPDEPTARDWLTEELSKPEYAQSQPGWWDRFWRWVEDLFTTAGPGAPAPIGLLLVLGAVVIAVVVILVVAGPLRSRSSLAAQAGAIFAEDQVDADGHRARATEAAARGRWDVAVREQFRAIVRDLQQRTILDSRPGLTADEAAHEAAARLPDHLLPLLQAARTFDDVVYGGHDATPAHYTDLVALDGALRRARPVLADVVTSLMPAVPR